ncbi:GIY-YIG nuclease family protein [Candidatus Binatia bacterium]|nr:GIY-YIG nuclease family protein [Candidatus Binatia bacterium]
MRYVYLIRSVADPTKRYVGMTADVAARLQAHNAGKSAYTAKFRPWALVTYLGFDDDQRAIEFERYLKTGSGHAEHRHFWRGDSAAI